MTKIKREDLVAHYERELELREWMSKESAESLAR